MAKTEKSKTPAIDSSVLILDLLASSSYPLTLSEICSQIDIPIASGHRIINTLLDHQMVAMDPSRKKSYCIGSKVFQIASILYNKQSIIPFFYPIAEILKNEIHKSVFLCIPVGNKVVVVSKVESSMSNTFNIYIGKTMALHQSAAGKAILSTYPMDLQKNYFKCEEKSNLEIKNELTVIKEDLNRSRRLGYSVTHGEIDGQISCIAAPISNLKNETVGAISVAINGERLTPQDARTYSKDLIQATRQLSARIV